MWTVRRTLLGVLVALSALAVLTAANGWWAVTSSNEKLKTVYNDRVVPLRDLKSVSDDYAVFVVDASHKVRNGNFSWRAGRESVAEAKGRIEAKWNGYLATELTAEEKTLTQTAMALKTPADAAVAKLERILVAEDAVALDAFIKNEMYQIIDPLTGEIAKLTELQVRVAGEEFAQAETAHERANLLALALIGLGLAGAGVGAYVTDRRVLRPVAGLTRAMSTIASGDLHADVPSTKDKTEIGEMARALEVVRAGAQQAEILRAENEAAKAAGETERKRAMADLAQKFEREVGGIVTTVTGSAAQLSELTRSMAGSIERTSQRSNAAATASEEASANVQTVAAAAEELSASIREIADRVTHSATMTQQASEAGRQTERVVGELTTAAERIGNIVDLIENIASQTNLLALNATIEAARAGDAGRGFAVVAHEVKGLAGQTAKATQEIIRQVSAIRSATQETVGMIEVIATSIGKVDEAATLIAAAVEEQGAATAEIARNVTEAASGTDVVNSNIAVVAEAAVEAETAAQHAEAAAAGLATEAGRLQDEVRSFLAQVA